MITEADLDRVLAELQPKQPTTFKFKTVPRSTSNEDWDGERITTDALLRRAEARVRPGENSNGRNRTGYWLALQLRDNGYSREEAEEIVAKYADSVSQEGHPYTLREATASVRSAYSHPARQPWRRFQHTYSCEENRQAAASGGSTELQEATADSPDGKLNEKPNEKQSEGHQFGTALLRIVSARRTGSGKLVLTVTVFKDGKTVDQVTVTGSTSGRREAARLIAKHGGDAADADVVIAKLIAEGATLADKPKTVQGKAIRDVVRQSVEQFALAYRTDGGAWSEARGCEIRRQDFITHVPSSLMDAATETRNAPRDNNGVIRPALLKVIKSELEVLWSDVTQSLPTVAEATLGQETAAGRKFRSALFRLWTTTGTWEKTGDIARRASLVSRMSDRLVEQKVNRNRRSSGEAKSVSRWCQILEACSAWFRLFETAEGEVVTYLAMNWELTHQMRVELPGVHDQKSLNRLGEQFGCLDTKPPMPTVTSGGRSRLAVLSRELTQLLMQSMALNAGVDEPIQ